MIHVDAENQLLATERLRAELVSHRQNFELATAAMEVAHNECLAKLATAEQRIKELDKMVETVTEQFEALAVDFGNVRRERDEARERVNVLRVALDRLDLAVDMFRADQTRATDKRVGLVQPVSVADCEELNAASRQAREILR